MVTVADRLVDFVARERGAPTDVVGVITEALDCQLAALHSATGSLRDADRTATDAWRDCGRWAMGFGVSRPPIAISDGIDPDGGWPVRTLLLEASFHVDGAFSAAGGTVFRSTTIPLEPHGPPWALAYGAMGPTASPSPPASGSTPATKQ